MTAFLECRQLAKHFGSRRVLTGVDWIVEQGTIAGLVGASGTGKTTLLRLLAGLERPTSGSIEGVAKRNVALVFQSLALWPHLTVRQHIEYVLPPQPRIDLQSVAEQFLREVRLPAEIWHSKPEQLSGGEAQRLALGRAVAPQPDLLLLDEPLAQVDLPLRHELMELIQSLVTRRGMTVVCVSHSWAEIMQLCQHVAVLRDGQIAQQGSIEEVYARPIDAEVARLTGPVVEIPQALLAGGCIEMPLDLLQSACKSADGKAIVIRPQQVQTAQPSENNRWQPIDSRPHVSGWMTILTNQTAAPPDGRHVTISLPSAIRISDPVSLHVSGL